MIDPKAHDEAMAAKFHELAKAKQQVAYSVSELLGFAGAKYYYRGRRRVTDMTLEEAIPLVREAVRELDEWEAAHEGEGKWVGYVGRIAPYEKDRARNAIPKYEARVADEQELREEIVRMDRAYTGWSRFFLVTSSAGHIHSSMNCSSCRPTTTYGWLPQLSGKDEAAAVADCGPTLCTVCFPSAPVDWTAGKKLTAAQAAKKVA